MSEWDGASLPANYKAAARAMENLATLDECVTWKNKGRAMASYARQMNDPSLEKRAWEVKERAERRFGELSAGIMPAVNQSDVGRTSTGPTGKGSKIKGKKKAAADLGVSNTQRKRAEQKAAMPSKAFERHIEEGKKRIEQKHTQVARSATRQDRMIYWLKAVETLAVAPSGGLRAIPEAEDMLRKIEAASANLTKLIILLRQARKLR